MTPARGPRPGRAFACAGVLLALAAPVAAHAGDAAHADAACAAPSSSTAASTARSWPAPLDRGLRIHPRDVSLRDALDRLSAAARIRISYSAELLPLDRRVCVSASARTVGDALTELLRDTPVEPVVAGTDHVVLALRRTRAAAADEAPSELSHTVALDRVVVTGSAGGGPRSKLPYALDVIGAPQLEREGTAPLSRFLTTAAAGPWAWEQTPSALIARYGSLRGASSFGASTPKVFIDGIEVANPLLVTQIAPEAVERIEVIRGPQGAALYGTDAISGVVNIVTRHEGTDGAPRIRVRSGLGMARSDFASGGAMAQEHAVSLRAGSSIRSAGMDVGVGGVGEYVPQGASRYLLASGNARVVGARSVLTGTARYYAAGAGPAENPLLRDVPAADSASGRQRMRQYTLGGSLRLTPDDTWTHTLIAGIDGDRVAGPLDAYTPVAYGAGAADEWSEGGADRLTLRWSSVARLYDGARADFAATLAAEHSSLRELVAAEPLPGVPAAGGGSLDSAPYELWTRSTGLVAQANATLDDRLHLTAGVRVERNGGLAGAVRDAWLPVLGAAWVTPLGDDASLKVRAAFGRGIRPVRTPARGLAWSGAHMQMRALGLEPEEQEGVEGGFDLAIGRVLQLQVTAFDQLASGLIQRVSVPADTHDGGTRGAGFRLQNMGRISNRGWEVQGSAVLGRASLEGAFSAVDSRVLTVASGYTGDLRRGDRMLEVPARTLSLTGAWAGDRWTASVTGYRAFDWINYDRLALARDYAGRGGVLPMGEELRAYWHWYPGVTHVNAVASMDMRTGWTLVVSGENLLDYQRGEPDNLTVVPGRTLSLGVRAAF